MLTKHKTTQIVYQILQFCSLVMISYLTYFKMYHKSFQSNLSVNVENNEQSSDIVKNVYAHNRHKYVLFTKFTNKSAKKYFGIFYLISYIIANFSSYFIFIMLVRYKHDTKFKSEWVLLVYAPYLWIFFSKLYHNEIVRYFTHVKNLDEKSSMIDKVKVESRIDTITFWLKMLIFTSLLCFVFSINHYNYGKNSDKKIKSLWLVQIVCAGCMVITSVMTLNCFSTTVK